PYLAGDGDGGLFRGGRAPCSPYSALRGLAGAPRAGSAGPLADARARPPLQRRRSTERACDRAGERRARRCPCARPALPHSLRGLRGIPLAGGWAGSASPDALLLGGFGPVVARREWPGPGGRGARGAPLPPCTHLDA